MKTEADYTDNQVSWLKAYTDAEFNSVRDAVGKVLSTTTAKFEAQNEWRAQMKDQAGTFVTKDTLDTIKAGLEKQLEKNAERIVDLQKFNSNLQGKFWVITILWPIILAIISYWISHR